MRSLIGWILIAAGLLGVSVAGWSALRILPEISSLRAGISARVEARRVTRDQLAEKNQIAAGARASRESLPDSLWAEERAAAFAQQQAYSKEIRALGAKEREHTRWIKFEEAKLARATRTLTLRAGAGGGAGLVLCVLGWVLARRRVGA
jgi:hypothetical protein